MCFACLDCCLFPALNVPVDWRILLLFLLLLQSVFFIFSYCRIQIAWVSFCDAISLLLIWNKQNKTKLLKHLNSSLYGSNEQKTVIAKKCKRFRYQLIDKQRLCNFLSCFSCLFVVAINKKIHFKKKQKISIEIVVCQLAIKTNYHSAQSFCLILPIEKNFLARRC